MMPIVAVVVLPAIIFSELVFAPFHAVHAFYVMVVTERLGVNLKLLGVLILPLTFLAVPFINILLCLLAVIVVTPFSMAAANSGLGSSSPRSENNLIPCILFSGAPIVLKHCVSGVCDVVDMHRHAVVNGLNEFKTLGAGEEKFDARFIQVVIGFIQAVLSIAILLAVNSVVGLVKLPFMIFHTYSCYCKTARELWKTPYWCNFFVSCPTPLIAPAVVIVYAASIFINIQWGVFCAMRAYDEGSVGAGIELLGYCLNFYDSATHEAMGFERQDRQNYVNWPKAKRNLNRDELEKRRAARRIAAREKDEKDENFRFREGVRQKERNGKNLMSNFENGESHPTMMAVWNNFFDMSSVEISRSIQKGLVSKSEVDSLEPFLFTGVASMVCFHCVQRSLSKHGPQDKFEVGRDCTALWPSSRRKKFYPGKITAVDEERKVCDILFYDGTRWTTATLRTSSWRRCSCYTMRWN